LVPTPDGGDDFVGIDGPGDGLGIIVGLSQEATDGSLEFDELETGRARRRRSTMIRAELRARAARFMKEQS
jgi:hypothetical protein